MKSIQTVLKKIKIKRNKGINKESISMSMLSACTVALMFFIEKETGMTIDLQASFSADQFHSAAV